MFLPVDRQVGNFEFLLSTVYSGASHFELENVYSVLRRV